ISLLKLDAGGQILWQKNYKVLNQGAGGSFITPFGNGYAICGNTSDTINTIDNGRIYYMKVDTGGNVMFTKRFPFYKNDGVEFGNLINNNRLLIGSFGFSLIYNDTNDAKIIIIDTMGIIIAQRLFTARNYIKMQSALVVTNGDFIFTGGVIES